MNPKHAYIAWAVVSSVLTICATVFGCVALSTGAAEFEDLLDAAGGLAAIIGMSLFFIVFFTD